jgi:hypothetical protein
VLEIIGQVNNKVKIHNRVIQHQVNYMLQAIMYDDTNIEADLAAASIRGLAYQFKCYLKNNRSKLYELLGSFSYEHVVGDSLSKEVKLLVQALDEKIDDCFNNYGNTNFAFMSEMAIESLIERIKLFGNEIINFASWDSQSSIELFGKSLIHVGKNIKDNGMCVNSKKVGIKAIKAGGMLINAYDDNDTTASKHFYNSLDKLNTSRGHVLDDVNTWGNDNYVHNYDQLRKNIDKARTVVYNEERNKKVSAWNNITKLVGKNETNQIPAIDRWCD